jgi:PhnB protein
MKTANLYLNFDGNCEEAFDFYKSVLGGEFSYLIKFKEMPPQEGMPPMSEEMGNMIMHIALPVSNETMLMGSDVGDIYAPAFSKGSNFSIFLNTDSQEEADRIFAGLSQDGIVTMPIALTFWGDYFGSFEDKFGVNWMISYSPQQDS